MQLHNEQINYQNLDTIIKKIKIIAKNNKILLLLDSNILKLYSEFKTLSLNNLYTEVFNSLELNKSLKKTENYWNILLKNNFSRNDYIFIVGGGVSLDIGSFVASTYKRGLKLIKIPTSLLAIIDASIGGKTALNYNTFKNTIGTFYFADEIIININFLKTLPVIEYQNGLVELVKYGFLGNQIILNFFKQKINQIKIAKLKDFSNFLTENEIKQAIHHKVKVVLDDYYDKGKIRFSLNFGHTLGHAIESLSKYKVKHGFAVAKGMKFAIMLSNKLSYLSSENTKIFLEILDNIVDDINLKFTAKDILATIKKDKKINKNSIDFVLINDKYQGIKETLDFNTLEKHLSDLCKF